MNLEVIHLVPGHLLNDLLQIIHRKCLTSDIQDESTYFIHRIVTSDTLWNRRKIALLQCLQDRSGCPVRTGLCLGCYHDLIGDIHQIAFLHQTQARILCLCEEEIAGSDIRTRSLDDRDRLSGQIFVISCHLICRRLQIIICIDDLAAVGQCEITGTALPLLKFRQYCRRFVVTSSTLISSRYGDRDFLKLIVFCFVIDDLERNIDLFVNDRMVDRQIIIDDLLQVRSIVGYGVAFYFWNGNLQFFRFDSWCCNGNHITDIAHGDCRCTTVYFHLVNGDAVPLDTTIWIFRIRCTDIQTNITCFLYII